MSILICIKDNVSMAFKNSDVYIKYDSGDIYDHSRYAPAELHVCERCDAQAVVIKSVKDEDFVFHKDLGPYRENFLILDNDWRYI